MFSWLISLTLSLFLAFRRDSKKISVIFANAFKSCRNSWKSDNFIGSNIEKKPWTNLQNRYKKNSKEKKVKSDNFCHRKVRIAITKWGTIVQYCYCNIGKWSILIGYQQLFCILGVPKIFSPLNCTTAEIWG